MKMFLLSIVVSFIGLCQSDYTNRGSLFHRLRYITSSTQPHRYGNSNGIVNRLQQLSDRSISSTCLVALAGLLNRNSQALNSGSFNTLSGQGSSSYLSPGGFSSNYNNGLPARVYNRLLPYIQNGVLGNGQSLNTILSILSFCNNDGNGSSLSTLLTYLSLYGGNANSNLDITPHTCANYYPSGNLQGFYPDPLRYCYPPCSANRLCLRNAYTQRCGCTTAAVNRCNQQCHNMATCQQSTTTSGTFRCVCNYPLQGDGIHSCRQQEIILSTSLPGFDLCNGQRCGSNAICSYDITQQRHRCRCKLYYTGDGYNCYYDSGNINDNSCLESCHSQATCLPFIGQSNRPYCQCNSGYTGNGRTCYPLSPPRYPSYSNTCFPPCDPINGYCHFNVQNQRHQCKCNSGYVMQTTGTPTGCVTDPSTTDLSNEALCSPPCNQNNFCTYSFEKFRFECKCKEGFSLQSNGQQCLSNNAFLPLATTISSESNFSPCIPTCGSNSYCKYDVQAQKYSCQCDEGYSKVDEYSCIASTLIERSCSPPCGRNALCDCVSQLECQCKCNPNFFAVTLQSGGIDCYSPFYTAP